MWADDCYDEINEIRARLYSLYLSDGTTAAEALERLLRLVGRSHVSALKGRHSGCRPTSFSETEKGRLVSAFYVLLGKE